MYPRISSYGSSSNRNYGVNTILFESENLDLYFSYQTVIAFRSPGIGLVISENEWGPTTGKHLNSIGHKDLRISRAEFKEQLQAILEKYGLETPRIDV